MNFELKTAVKRRKISETADVAANLAFAETVDSVANRDVPLVIPLPAPLRVVDPETAAPEILSLDELAVKELIQELSGESKSDSNLTIPATSAGNSAAARLTSKKQPLLIANLDQRLLGDMDDEQRFKLDIELRAEDVNFKSDKFKEIPVEQFGAAMLRGMGWSGLSKEDEDTAKKLDKVQMRDGRLGLGAVPKPPDPTERKGGKNDERVKEWKKTAEEKLKKQQIEVGSLIWIRDPKYALKRAKIVAVKGVPGLDRIRVRLERGGRLIEIKKTDAVLLLDVDLETDPYNPDDDAVEAIVDSRDRVEKSTTDKEREGSSTSSSLKRLSGEQDDANVKLHHSIGRSSGRSGGEVSRDDNRPAREDHRRDRYLQADTSAKSEPRSQQKPPPQQNWLLTGIRVRIISAKVGGEKLYKAKAWVEDVSGSGVACIRLDDGRVIQGAKQKYLETVLPRSGELCMVVKGRCRGQEARLLDKNKEKEIATIQLTEELEILEIPMDDIAAYTQSVA